MDGLAESRIEALRRRVIDTPPSVCHERAVLVTEVYQEYGQSLSPIRVRTKALARVLDNISISIGKDELVVGMQASRVRAAPLFPEYSWDWILDELDSFETRYADAFQVSDDTRRIVSDTLGWWEGKSLKDRALKALPKEVLQAQDLLVLILTSMSCGVGHLAPNYAKVIQRGFNDIRQEALDFLEEMNLDKPQDSQKADFYRAAIEVCEVVCRFAERYADLAMELAASEKDPVRNHELREITRICRKVPANPADSFWEAVQSFWFIHLIIQIEANGHFISPGRFDQFLYDFFRKDLESGSLTKASASEIMSCLWIKFNES